MGEASDLPSATPSGQLSDPFRNMCIQSQGMAAPSGAHFQRPPVPLFSQIPPTTSNATAANGAGCDGADIPCSQIDYLGTQDFITPADQFDLEYDPGVPAVRQRSPAQLSPSRIKRARKGTDSDADAPAMALPSLGVPLGAPGRGAGGTFAPPMHRRPIARIQSPPCYRNMFQDDNENEKDTFKEWRISRSLPSHQQPLSRFRVDFKELGCIGQGTFSKVFKVRHRIDGKIYAVKRTMKEVVPEQPEFGQFLQEAQVLAHLEPHPSVVRYYGCWTETGIDGGERLFMQLELCDIALGTHVGLGGERMTEGEIVGLTRQIASALQHLHAHGVAHLDIKPANIYLKFPETEGGEEGDENAAAEEDNTGRISSRNIIFKLGDFGQATRLQNYKITGGGEASVHEGDCRYLPLEVMNSNYSALDKSDMFSLGAMMFELASGMELPQSGQTYQDLRQGKVPLLPTATSAFMRLIRALLSPDPKDRPSASKVLQMAPLVVKKSAAAGVAAAVTMQGQENILLPQTKMRSDGVPVMMSF